MEAIKKANTKLAELGHRYSWEMTTSQTRRLNEDTRMSGIDNEARRGGQDASILLHRGEGEAEQTL